MAIPIEIKGMAPLLMVYDMPTTLAFYRDKLGFTIDPRFPIPHDEVDWALLTLYGVEVMFNTMYEKPNRPPQPDAERTLAHNDTSLYFGCPDIDAAYHYFHSKGVDLKPPILTGYGFKAIYILDPDGYYLVFHWPASQP